MADDRDVPGRPAIPDRCLYIGTGCSSSKKGCSPWPRRSMTHARSPASATRQPSSSSLLFLVPPVPVHDDRRPHRVLRADEYRRDTAPVSRYKQAFRFPCIRYTDSARKRISDALRQAPQAKPLPFNNGIFHMFLTCGPTGTSTSSTSHNGVPTMHLPAAQLRRHHRG